MKEFLLFPSISCLSHVCLFVCFVLFIYVFLYFTILYWFCHALTFFFASCYIFSQHIRSCQQCFLAILIMMYRGFIYLKVTYWLAKSWSDRKLVYRSLISEYFLPNFTLWFEAKIPQCKQIDGCLACSKSQRVQVFHREIWCLLPFRNFGNCSHVQ